MDLKFSCITYWQFGHRKDPGGVITIPIPAKILFLESPSEKMTSIFAFWQPF